MKMSKHIKVSVAPTLPLSPPKQRLTKEKKPEGGGRVGIGVGVGVRLLTPLGTADHSLHVTPAEYCIEWLCRSEAEYTTLIWLVTLAAPNAHLPPPPFSRQSDQIIDGYLPWESQRLLGESLDYTETSAQTEDLLIFFSFCFFSVRQGMLRQTGLYWSTISSQWTAPRTHPPSQTQCNSKISLTLSLEKNMLLCMDTGGIATVNYIMQIYTHCKQALSYLNLPIILLCVWRPLIEIWFSEHRTTKLQKNKINKQASKWNT